MDVTTLALAVDSTQVNTASAALDKMAASGTKAETAATQLTRVTTEQGKALSGALVPNATKAANAVKDLSTAQAAIGTAGTKNLAAGASELGNTATNASNASTAVRQLGREAEAAGQKVNAAFSSASQARASQSLVGVPSAPSAASVAASAIGAASSSSRQALAAAGFAAVGTASKAAGESIDEYIKKLQTTVVTNGMSARETKLYELAVRGASVAQLQAADSAIRMAEGYEKGVAIGNKVRTTLLAIGAAAVAGTVAAALAFEHLIKKAGEFEDAATKTGDTASNIASLAVAAASSGTSIDSVVNASTRLTKTLTGVDDESKKAGAALSALGLDIQTFKNLKPADQFEAVAKALNGFRDGTEKSAVAASLFGVEGAKILPFLKDLSAEGGRQFILTDEQIKQAQAFTSAQAAQREQITLYAQAIASKAIPTISAFTELLRDIARDQEFAATASDVLKGALSAAVTIFQTLAIVASDVGFVFKGVGREIGAIAAQIAALGRGDLKGFSAISEAVKEDGVRARAELDKFQARIAAIGKPSTAVVAATAATPDTRPKLQFDGAIKKPRGSADREAQQVLLAQAAADEKQIQDLLNRRKDAFAFAEQFLQGAYRAGELSLKEFFDRQRENTASGADAQIATLEEKKARLAKLLAEPAFKDPSQRETVKGKIADLTEEQARARQLAGQNLELSNQREAASFKQLNEQVQNYRANLLQMQGDELGAARLRNQLTVDQARILAKQAEDRTPGGFSRLDRGQAASPVDVSALEKALADQATLNDVKSKTSAINEVLAIQEQRIALAQSTGAVGEIAALGQIGAARQQAVQRLEVEVQKMEEIAAKNRELAAQAKEPINLQLQIDTSKARLAVDQLKAQLDPLKEKFDGIFKDAGANLFGDLMNGTKPLAALKNFANNIGKQINDVVAKNLSESLFGNGGAFGGAGGFLADIFGGKGRKNGGVDGKPTVDTSGVQQSFSSLATQGIDPTISAFARLQSAIDSTANSVGAPAGSATTGDFARLDRGQAPAVEAPTTGDFARLDRGQTSGEQGVMDLFRDASKSSETLGDSNTKAASAALQLASAAVRGGGCARKPAEHRPVDHHRSAGGQRVVFWRRRALGWSGWPVRWRGFGGGCGGPWHCQRR
jgi:hypothetical protein